MGEHGGVEGTFMEETLDTNTGQQVHPAPKAIQSDGDTQNPTNEVSSHHMFLVRIFRSR